MKRQNSSTSDNDDHSRTSDSNNTIHPLEMSSPILMTPPYNRNSASSGRRRKKLYSAAAEKRDDNKPSLIVPSLIASPGGSALPASAASGTNSPTTSNNHDATNNTTNQKMTMQKSQEDDKDTSKKLKAPNRNRNPFFPTMYHMLTNKLQYYRKKLSNLTPRQKLVVCTLLIVWKFIQAWLIVRGVVWLSGGSAAVANHHGGVNNGGGEGVSVVQVGRSLDQRMKLDGELQVEIELSRVEEDRLEERLWMDKDGHQYVRLEEDERGDGSNDGMMEEWIEESGVDTMAATRILYMLTVTCSTQQPQFSPHASNESSTTQQQREDGTTNANDSSSKLNSSATNTNIDSILSTLSTNIQTMIAHPEGYAVDVYWIMGCAWSDYNSMLSSSANKLNNNEEVSEYWKEYIAQQLPNGVGLQVWEDAMPLDYSAVAVPHKEKTVGQQQQQRQGRQSSQSDAQFYSSAKKGEDEHYAAATLAPSIDKFMKQHRYVVRDKLDYYDVFLSFGASLEPHHPHPSSANSGIVELSGELVQVNGTFVQFCTKNLYRDTTISCNDRLEYLTKRYGISKNVAMVSLLKEKECICTADGGDLEAVIPSSQSLERITGDHIYTFLSMSSELNELSNGQHIIPGFLAVDAAPPAAGKSTNDFGSQQFHLDASPCCDSDSMELTVETKGGVAINADEWQMVKVETANSADVSEDKIKDETPSPLSEWIAVERRRKSGEGTTRPTYMFYEDGWMLTKDQLLRFDYGSNRGKFLPPFTSENSIHDSSMSKHGLTCPLFESKDIGGLDLRRAISLDLNEFSRQLIHPVSPPSKVSKNVSLGAKELLSQFHNAKKKM